jgi:hypothetical protein
MSTADTEGIGSKLQRLIVNCQLSIVNADFVRLGSFLTAEGAEIKPQSTQRWVFGEAWIVFNRRGRRD